MRAMNSGSVSEPNFLWKAKLTTVAKSIAIPAAMLR